MEESKMSDRDKIEKELKKVQIEKGNQKKGNKLQRRKVK